MRHLVEMSRRNRGRGQPGHKGRNDHPKGEPRPCGPAARLPRHGTQSAKDSNQRRRGGKGHLEPRTIKRFGPKCQHDQRRDRDCTQGDRTPVQKKGHEHHRHHDKGTLRRHIAPRQGQIDRTGHQSTKGGDLARRPPERHASQPIAQGGKDKAGQQPHVQARDSQKMGKIGRAQILHHLAVEGRTVAGGDRGGKSPLAPRQGRAHRVGNRHAQPVDPKAEPAPIVRGKGQNRGSRVPHGPQTLKPGVAAEVVPPGFDRTARGREMPGQDHRDTGFRLKKALLPVKRHPHAGGCPVRGNVAQNHPVKRQTHRIRHRAVNGDDPSLDRAVIAKGQDLFGHRMRPVACNRKPGRQQKASGENKPHPRPGQKGRQQKKTEKRCNHAPIAAGRFEPKGKVQPDTRPIEHRHPGKKKSPLPVQLTNDPGHGARSCHLPAP